MSKTRKNILTGLANKFGVLGDAISSSKELTESEVMAQYVISLLRSGRADEVTDEMLSAADDAYLYKNYDLPMDEASRLARAKDADFVDAYHGTGDVFESVDEGRFGTGIDAYGQGFYSTTATERADRYIPKKPYITGDELDEDLYEEGGNIIPVKLRVVIFLIQTKKQEILY